jgi:hypothetical protein
LQAHREEMHALGNPARRTGKSAPGGLSCPRREGTHPRAGTDHSRADG